MDLGAHRLVAPRAKIIAEGAREADVITHHTVVGDLSALRDLANSVYATFGAVDLLINNAGTGGRIFDTEAN